MAATTIEPTPTSNTDGEQPVGDGNSQVAVAPVAKRVYFRAFVRTGGQVGASRERDRVEWHLSACTSPHTELGHCTEGLHMIETIGHPDGHCIIEGFCGLCGAPQPVAE
jgi:hypothetical protein